MSSIYSMPTRDDDNGELNFDQDEVISMNLIKVSRRDRYGTIQLLFYSGGVVEQYVYIQDYDKALESWKNRTKQMRGRLDV